MKRMSLNIPERIYRKWKLWLATAEGNATQEDWICWLFENLPESPEGLKVDTDLLDILDNNKGKLQYSPDQKKILGLIAKGLLEPTEEEQALVLKVKKKK